MVNYRQQNLDYYVLIGTAIMTIEVSQDLCNRLNHNVQSIPKSSLFLFPVINWSLFVRGFLVANLEHWLWGTVYCNIQGLEFVILMAFNKTRLSECLVMIG